MAAAHYAALNALRASPWLRSIPEGAREADGVRQGEKRGAGGCKAGSLRQAEARSEIAEPGDGAASVRGAGKAENIKRALDAELYFYAAEPRFGLTRRQRLSTSGTPLLEGAGAWRGI